MEVYCAPLFVDMDKIPRTVIFYFNGTFLRRENGAHARASSFVDFLIRTFDRVIVYSYLNHPTCRWSDNLIESFKAVYPTVSLILDESTKPMKVLTRFKNFATALFPSMTRLILALRVPGAAPNFRHLIKTEPGALLVVNYEDGLTQLNRIDRNDIVLETHDVKFANYNKQTKSKASSLRSTQKFRGELALLDAAGAIIAISPMEASFFRMMLTDAEIFYIPHFGPSYASAAGEDGLDARYKYDLVFVGSHNILNVNGLLRFWREEHAWVHKFRFAICGKVCEHPAVSAYAALDQNISLLGFVDDISRVYAGSKAAVSPVDGTGLKIKVIEALAHGRPVFASPQSLDGLAVGYEGSVFPIDRRNIELIVGNPPARQVAQRAAAIYFSKIGDTERFTHYARAPADCPINVTSLDPVKS